MKHFAIATFLVALALPLAVASQKWEHVSLMDGHCIEDKSSDPDSHPRVCALQCASGGYGVITADGKFLRFDEAGNAKALAALKKSEKKDHLRVTVTGSQKDDVIAVSTITLD